MINRFLKCSLFLGLACIILFSSCSSAPESRTSSENSSVFSGNPESGDKGTLSPASISDGVGTPLAIPERSKQKKNDLDSTVLGFIEKGSPDSIRKAVALVNTDPRGMTDQNRIALAVSGELMKILYPLEEMNWLIPSVPDSDRYIGALLASRQGVYDYSAGSSDFLSLVLPSVVLVFSDIQGSYYSDAEVALSKARKMNAESVLPLYFLALISERQGRMNEALNYFQTAWNFDSSCYPAGIGLTRSFLAKGDGQGALSVARQLLSRYPNNTSLIRLCAESAYLAQDWNTADPYILSILKAEPENTDFLLMRARILVERKEYLKASSLLDAFGTTNKTNKTYLLLKSRVLREWNKNPTAAALILQDARRLYPKDSEVLLASAEISYQSGQAIQGADGRDLVLRVLEMEPTNTVALSLLVQDYILSADWPRALSSAEKLVSLDSKDDALVLLLKATLGSRHYSRAADLSRSLYEKQASSLVITSLYLQSLISSGDLGQAQSIITSRLVDASPSLKSILYYHESTLKVDPDARLASLRSSLLSDPRNLDALFSMYEWYMERKDYRKAQYYLKQVVSLDPSNRNYGILLSNLDDLLAR